MRYRPPLLEEPCAQTLSGKKLRGSFHDGNIMLVKCGSFHLMFSPKCLNPRKQVHTGQARSGYRRGPVVHGPQVCIDIITYI